MTLLPPTEPEDEPGQTALVLRLGGERFAVPLAGIGEVSRPGVLTRVPGLPSWLQGVANHRGRVLPVADLRGMLGTGEGPDERARWVVLRSEGTALGLHAEAVDGLLELPARLEPPLVTLPGPARRLLAGQTADAAGPVAVLDVAAVLRLSAELPRAGRAA